MLLSAIAAVGCQQAPTHLAYVHNMSLGVDLSASAEEGQVKLAVGFDRKIFALVPRTSDADDADVMSVYSASRVVVAGLETTKFGHVVATGDPASKMAEDPYHLADLVTKLFDDAPDAKTGTSTPASNPTAERRIAAELAAARGPFWPTSEVAPDPFQGLSDTPAIVSTAGREVLR